MKLKTDPARSFSVVNLSSDPIYKYIEITRKDPQRPEAGSEYDLLDSGWLQRLRRIHQLQSAWWVFPSGEHSRFQHSMGAMHLAGSWARHLHPSLCEAFQDCPSLNLVEELLRLTGLLHDVGHGPFGHFFDEQWLQRWGITHEDIGRSLITGPLASIISSICASPGGSFAGQEQIDPRWIAYLISQGQMDGFAPPSWLTALKPLFCGSFTADNMDYVVRDSYMCGIDAGPVDVHRLIHYTFICERGLALHGHAAEALLMFLNVRLYLYNNVYYHRTVRRIDLQMREIFAPTMELLGLGSPLDNLDAYLGFNEWSLINEMDRWARSADDPQRRGLGQSWQDIINRKLKWKMVFQDHISFPDRIPGTQFITAESLKRSMLLALPSKVSEGSFEVDVASLDARPQNPFSQSGMVLLYDPLTSALEESAVSQLLSRLPQRTSLFRIFARDTALREPLTRAAKEVLRGELAPAFETNV